MKDHNGVLMMQRMLLAGTLGLAMARKAAAILEGEPAPRGESQGTEARVTEGAVLPHPPQPRREGLQEQVRTQQLLGVTRQAVDGRVLVTTVEVAEEVAPVAAVEGQ